MPDDPAEGRRRVPGTKLAVPQLLPRLVPRPRLLAMLDRARASMVTLVSAPAGTGKTLLLAEWARERATGETAWVSLDSDDNDDGRFWSALLDALSTTAAVPRDSPLRRLAVPTNPSGDPGFLAEVVNALDELPRPVVLILDDLHEITTPQPLQGLAALLQHQPADLRLILSARQDPHLPIARLRLADELTEIHAENLKFSADEVRALLDADGIELDHDQLQRLLEQTEGWAAALRLATLSLAGGSEPDRFLADFAANDRAVAAYLVDEVLSRLPTDMSEFLRTISISEQISADLAARLSGRADAAALLDAIAERTSLVVRVRSRHALLVGDVDELARVTEDITDEANLFDAATMLQRGTAMLATGNRAAAREQLRGAQRAARTSGHDYVAVHSLTMLAGLAAAEGDYGSMTMLATEANEENARRGWQQTVEAATASVILGYGALLRADPAECVRKMVCASRLVDEGDPPAMRGLNLLVETLRGAAEFELGNRTAGARRVDTARRASGSARFSVEQTALCAVLEHRMALLLGWSTEAGEALRWAQNSVPDAAEVRLMRARAQLVLGRSDAASKIIQPVLDGAVRPVLPWLAIEAWLLATEVALSAGDDARARRWLRRALLVSHRLDVPYPVVFADPAVADLLTGQLGKLGGATERFADWVCALRRALHVPPMVPLTARERAVLRLLPTQRSFDEIAEDLTVSANTVKTHVRAIYAKLGVTRRRDAVSVALERGLFETEHAANP